MPDYKLTAEPFLAGYTARFGTTTLDEITDTAIVSIAVPNGGAKALDGALKKAWGVTAPQVGQSVLSKDGKHRLMRMGPDQMLVLLPAEAPQSVPTISNALGERGYYTEQTDNWVMLRIKGPLAVPALTHLSMLDVETMAPNTAVRSVIEHLGSVLLREDEDSFVLMSASSSAHSFQHAIAHALAIVA